MDGTLQSSEEFKRLSLTQLYRLIQAGCPKILRSGSPQHWLKKACDERFILIKYVLINYLKISTALPRFHGDPFNDIAVSEKSGLFGCKGRKLFVNTSGAQ